MRHESENRLDSMMDAAIDQAIAGGQEKDLESAAITLFLKARDDVELASFQDKTALPGSRISETRETTDGSAELNFRIQFPPAPSLQTFGS